MILMFGFNADINSSIKKALGVPTFWVSAEKEPVLSSDLDYHSIRDDFYSPYEGQQIILTDKIRSIFPYFHIIIDHYYRHWMYKEISYPEISNLAHAHLLHWGRVLLENKPKLVLFNNVPHEGIDTTLYFMAKLLGIPVRLCFQIPFAPRTWVLKSISDLPKIYQRSGRLPPPWTNDSLPHIRKYLNACRGIGQHFYMDNYHPTEKLVTSDRNFYYFPLHKEPEMAVSALGIQKFTSQLQAISYAHEFCKNNDMLLVIKENPKQIQGSRFYRGVHFWRRLSMMSNLRIVSSNVTSNSIIDVSEGVITISGTAGFEAALQGKPVISLGETWWTGLPGVFQDVQPVEKLKTITLNTSNEFWELILARMLSDSIQGCASSESNSSFGRTKSFNDEEFSSALIGYLGDFA